MALDEAPPADIEIDLFSDDDGVGDSSALNEPSSPVTAFESLPSNNSPASLGTEERQIPGFAEDGHPLGSLITLGVNDHQAGDLDVPAHSAHIQQSPFHNANGLAPDPLDDTASPSTSSSPSSDEETILPFKCRICHKTPPRNDVSATFCGHVFCRPCITDEVMARSKCPVCSSPTLLYCIFKLDLGP